jgi:hypothetical protein
MRLLNFFLLALGCMAICLIFPSNADADGRLTGDAAAPGCDVALFDRDSGMIWNTRTGPDGRFESIPLKTGTYLAVLGRRIAPVEIRNWERTEVVWSEQPDYHTDMETWSPTRYMFGQTFLGFAPGLEGLSFWIPCGPPEILLELREEGIRGKSVNRKTVVRPRATVSRFRLRPDEWPTTPGKPYYLSISASNREPFVLGMPAVGEVYPEGQAYYDGEPALDTDMGFILEGNQDGLLSTFTSGKSLGVVREGPAAGLRRWAAQEFVATTRNVVSARANASWPTDQDADQEFIYSIHRGGPEGKPAGPARRLRMTRERGAIAAWFPDQVSLEPGEKYALRIARADGQTFHVFLAEGEDQNGQAVRAGPETPDLNLDCEIRGETAPGGLVFPYNVGINWLSRSEAAIEWQTAVPARGELLWAPQEGEWRTISAGVSAARVHQARIEDLTAGTRYRYVIRVTAETATPTALLSRIFELSTLPDPRRSPESRVDSSQAGSQEVKLANPSFEEGLAGWTFSQPPRNAYHKPLPDGVGELRIHTDLKRHKAHTGQAACGWLHIAGSESGQIPWQLRPELTQTLSQRVRVQMGARYVLSAWILTDEVEGGWNRNDRVRLCVDPSGGNKVGQDERFVTQWYTTRGQWLRRRLAFKAGSDEVEIGMQFYHWWMLKENYLFVDDVRLIRLPEE